MVVTWPASLSLEMTKSYWLQPSSRWVLPASRPCSGPWRPCPPRSWDQSVELLTVISLFCSAASSAEPNWVKVLRSSPQKHRLRVLVPPVGKPDVRFKSAAWWRHVLVSWSPSCAHCVRWDASVRSGPASPLNSHIWINSVEQVWAFGLERFWEEESPVRSAGGQRFGFGFGSRWDSFPAPSLPSQPPYPAAVSWTGGSDLDLFL